MNSPDPPIPLIPTPSPIRSAESFVARGLCLCAILGTLTRYLGRWHWVFEITTHFVVQATVLAGIATLLLLVRRHWRLAAITGLLTVMNAAEWVPFYTSKSLTSFASDHTKLDVVSVNVYSRNRNSQDLYRWLKETHAEVVFISEVDPWWASQIESWKADWPYQILEPHEDNFGLALISCHPITDSHLFQLESLNPAVDCRIQAPGGDWTVVGLHPYPPAGGEYSTLRNQQLTSAAKRIA